MIEMSWIRLIQLISPALPVGAYTYSQALEWAVEAGRVHDDTSALVWIEDCLEYGCARFDAVYLAHMIRAWVSGNTARALQLNEDLIASRESAELRAETLQMGHSLRRLLLDLDCFPADPLENLDQCSFPLSWSYAVAQWGVDPEQAVVGYVWSWLENQTMAAVKLVPLGQTQGQSLLVRLGTRLPHLAAQAMDTPITQATNYMPAFAIASCCHETQYTRLFRS